MTRTFTDSPAVRSRVPLLIGLVSASGAGKTYSALRLATGIVSVSGGEAFVIDTEARRALHYADKFRFRHVPFDAPYNPLSYLDVIRHCVARGAGCIIIDSMSHEHEGEGGVLDMQEAELQRVAGDDYEKRKRCAAMAWIKPKGERRKMTNGIVQLACNFVFCFRAQEKLDWKHKNAKGEPTEQGWQPIAAQSLVYEMTARALLMPGSEGVPDWNPQIAAEKALIKRPEQFRGLFDRMKGQQISEEMGAEMARWAAGGEARTPFQDLIGAIAKASDHAALEAMIPALSEARDKRSITKTEYNTLREAYAEQGRKLGANERSAGHARGG